MSGEKLLLNYDKYLILPGKIRLVLAENIALRIRLAVTCNVQLLQLKVA